VIDRMLTFSGLLLWVLVIGGVAGAYAGEPEAETEAKSDWQRGYDLGFSHGAEIMQTFADNVDECLHAGTICCTDFINCGNDVPTTSTDQMVAWAADCNRVKASCQEEGQR